MTTQRRRGGNPGAPADQLATRERRGHEDHGGIGASVPGESTVLSEFSTAAQAIEAVRKR